MLYHRYEVEGLETLLDGKPALIVGYHGRPFAYDMCMLTVHLHDKLGYMPHAIVHQAIDSIAPLKSFFDRLGFVTGDDASLAKVVARGEHLVVTPGGSPEGGRSLRHQYELRWDKRTGYVKLARKHRLRIVPVAAAGADDAYLGLTDSEDLGRRLGLPKAWAWLPWLGFGPLGIYPFSPPFPVRMRQFIGRPIDPFSGGDPGESDASAVARVHEKVTRSMRALLKRARQADIGLRPPTWCAERLGYLAPLGKK
jgi:1-acyl-sn-glycerol-3-phosphate acyltransferase